jgi:brefeldin A-resistance guanine nucleotide exchange factor 1
LRILAVMRELICGDGGSNIGTFGIDAPLQHSSASPLKQKSSLADCLGDESICEMMETGLSMCCQMRLSDLLRRTAEQSMTTMVRALFSRLYYIPLTADEAYSTDPNMPEVEPEHATLVADPVGEDAVELDKEKKLRRMTMPDPKSKDIPAAAGFDPSVLQELKEMGEQEEQAERLSTAEGEKLANSTQGDEGEGGNSTSNEVEKSQGDQRKGRRGRTVVACSHRRSTTLWITGNKRSSSSHCISIGSS